MKTPFKLLLAISLAPLSALFALALASQAWAETPHIRVEFGPEFDAVSPGQSFIAALSLKPDTHWHVYWKNPGDSGLAPKLEWKDRAGFETGELQFPTPSRVPTQTLVNFGFEGERLLWVMLKAPADLKAGEKRRLKLKASWLVCQEECVPGKEEFEFEIEGSKEGLPPKLHAHWGARIQESLQMFPMMDAKSAGVDSDFKGIARFGEVDWAHWTMGVMGTIGNAGTSTAPRPFGSGFFFPEDSLIEPSSVPKQAKVGEKFHLFVALKKQVTPGLKLKGVIKLFKEGDDRGGPGFVAFSVDEKARPDKTPKTELSQIFSTAIDSPLPKEKGSESAGGGFQYFVQLFTMLFFAFLGGVILNLMPCVFPVLSIKVLGFIELSKADSRALRRHGWSFAFGVLASFLALGLVLYFLQSTGSQIGWGFQLQSPFFVAVLSLIFFLMGLNLFGFFEFEGSLISFGTRFTGKLASQKGLMGSFFTGVLTTVAATPCSAPFMSTALGYALTQPFGVGLLILEGLGLGLALPTLVLCYLPALIQKLPKPGAWMKTFKEVLAFPLFGTAIWLLTVLVSQAGQWAATQVLILALLLSFAIWLSRKLKPFVAWIAIASLLGLIYAADLLPSFRASEGSSPVATPLGQTVQTGHGTQAGHGVEGAPDLGLVKWIAYSESKLQEAVAKDRPVFVDFTADWCVTCKVNEKLVLETVSVQSAFREAGVLLLRADWTSADRSITQALEKNGRNSVPLYLWYPPGSHLPEILPQVLSPSLVIEKVKKSIQTPQF